MDPHSVPAAGTRRRRWDALDLVDVFVYVVVLNLAVQFVPTVISETFTLSLLTAALLKVTLDVVLVMKQALLRTWRTARSPTARTCVILGLWVVAAGSKLLVLELIARVFDGSVQLGGVIAVTALVVVMLAARAGMRHLLERPRAEPS